MTFRPNSYVLRQKIICTKTFLYFLFLCLTVQLVVVCYVGVIPFFHFVCVVFRALTTRLKGEKHPKQAKAKFSSVFAVGFDFFLDGHSVSFAPPIGLRTPGSRRTLGRSLERPEYLQSLRHRHVDVHSCSPCRGFK